MSTEGEHSGGNVNYYLAEIPHPKRLAPYVAECEDIIEALNMTFAEGSAFKAIWRSCAERTLGKLKRGGDSVRDAEKVIYYGGRMLAVRTMAATIREAQKHEQTGAQLTGAGSHAGVSNLGERGTSGGSSSFGASGIGGRSESLVGGGCGISEPLGIGGGGPASHENSRHS